MKKTTTILVNILIFFIILFIIIKIYLMDPIDNSLKQKQLVLKQNVQELLLDDNRNLNQIETHHHVSKQLQDKCH